MSSFTVLSLISLFLLVSCASNPNRNDPDARLDTDRAFNQQLERFR